MAQNIGDILIKAISKQTSKVDYFAYVENISPNTAVHEVRKAYKRIRSLLKFYPLQESGFPVLDKNEISAFGKALSEYRNSCVNLQILEKVTKENPHISEQKLKLLKEKLSAKNTSQLDQIAKNKLGKRIRKHNKDFENRLNQTKVVIDKNLIPEKLRHSFEKSFKVYSDTTLFESAERMHLLRKRLKVLYYQSNFLKFADARFFKTKSDQLNIITEALGDDHDLFVFLEEMKTPDYGLDLEETTILENKVNYLRELNMVKLQPRLKQFFSETPESFNKKIENIFSA
ncbi:MAG: CHAD domain-containing protein [Draconibacterium sp.]|nr:CHAD domain-containing protein [Draconibacterium sp.]